MLPIVWTNDDITYGKSEALQRQLDFLDRHGVPGVFFVIPKSGEFTIDQDVVLMRMIEAARSNGHEFYQHGYVHTAFESGVPELWMLDFSEPTRRQYDERRFEIEASHTFDALVTMLERGRRIWRRALGDDSPGYRPGWGAYCANLYRGLAALGFDWVSSRLPCPTSWLWNQGRWDAPIDFREAVTTQPHRIQGILEFPIAGDYAFRVPNDPAKIDLMAGLADREFEIYHERQHPMLIVSHHHGLSHPGNLAGLPDHVGGTGYAVHEKIIPRLRATGRAEFIGMDTLMRKYSPVA